MRFQFSDLWRFEGTIDRRTYALVGVIGFAIKHNLDRFVATFVFHRPWHVLNYWIPAGQAVRITSLPRKDIVFLVSMIALALPFIWIGVALTMRRLRSAGLPAWLVALFFLPVINLFFFLVLCVLPSVHPEDVRQESRQDRRATLLGRIIPRSAGGSAVIASLSTLAVGLALTFLGTSVLKTYGWGVFVALPFCLGLASVLIYSYHQPRSYSQCLAVAALSTGLLAAALIALAIEGVICVAMVAPLALILAMMGGSIGYLVQRRPSEASRAPALISLIFLFIPALMGVERMARPEPPIYELRTAIEVNAPPLAVWQQVVAFAQIPEPRELLFRAGIAYPIRAEIRGHGAGAERHCVFSTGEFVEPIEVWDEPRQLKFSVSSNPAPMQEWTPYSTLDTPHLRGFLVSQGGQFLLTPLPGGHTRLEGTTWYRHSMWPAEYWRVWSDFIIHRIHLRVLRHIERLAASDPIRPYKP